MNLDDLRAISPILSSLDDDRYAQLAALATEISLDEDEYLFRANAEACRFFIIAKGIVALEAELPAHEPIVVQTVGPGSLLGLSWRLAPRRWMWTARAMTATRLAAFDGNAVLDACAKDHELDRALWEAVATEAAERLHNTRVQLLDLYGRPEA